MTANTPWTDPIEQPKKSASRHGLADAAFRSIATLSSSTITLRPGGVRRIIELALPHIAPATPNPLEAIVVATGEKPENNWREILTRSLPRAPVHFFCEPAFRYLIGAAIIARGDSRKSAFGSRKAGGGTFRPAETLFGRRIWARAQSDSFR